MEEIEICYQPGGHVMTLTDRDDGNELLVDNLFWLRVFSNLPPLSAAMLACSSLQSLVMNGLF